MGFTGKSACKQTVPSSLLRQVHSLFAEGLPISDNTLLYAQSAPFLFKHCPNPVAALEFFPSVSYTFTSTEPVGCRQILGHLQPVSQIQDFSQLLQQVILSTSRFLLANFILASAGFKNISVPIKNRSFTPKKSLLWSLQLSSWELKGRQAQHPYSREVPFQGLVPIST